MWTAVLRLLLTPRRGGQWMLLLLKRKRLASSMPWWQVHLPPLGSRALLDMRSSSFPTRPNTLRRSEP